MSELRLRWVPKPSHIRHPEPHPPLTPHPPPPPPHLSPRAVTLAGALVALAVCVDVAVQYAREFGLEMTTAAPPLTSAPDGASGRVSVRLVAAASNVNVTCALLSLGMRGKAQGTWKLEKRDTFFEVNETLAASTGDGRRKYCVFDIAADNVLLALPYFDAASSGVAQASSAVSGASLIQSTDGTAGAHFTVFSGLQIVDWSVVVADSKEGAWTSARPASRVRTGVAASAGANMTVAAGVRAAVPSSQRVHGLYLRLMGSRYADRSFFDSVGETVSFGHRASFVGYEVQDAAPGTPGATTAGTSSSARGDTFRLAFSRADVLYLTVKVPRFGILTLIGVICGLAGGVVAAFKATHEYGEALCACSRVQARLVRAKLSGQRVGRVTEEDPSGALVVVPGHMGSATTETEKGQGKREKEQSQDVVDPAAAELAELKAWEDMATAASAAATRTKAGSGGTRSIFREPSLRLFAYSSESSQGGPMGGVGKGGAGAGVGGLLRQGFSTRTVRQAQGGKTAVLSSSAPGPSAAPTGTPRNNPMYGHAEREGEGGTAEAVQSVHSEGMSELPPTADMPLDAAFPSSQPPKRGWMFGLGGSGKAQVVAKSASGPGAGPRAGGGGGGGDALPDRSNPIFRGK
jgi:hypothetical protein